MLCLTLLALLRGWSLRVAVAAVSDHRNRPISGWRNLLSQQAAVRDRRYSMPNFLTTDLRYVALSVMLAALLMASLSCGGGSNGGGGTPPPSAESGTVTVTGTSTSISHTTTISVSVS